MNKYYSIFTAITLTIANLSASTLTTLDRGLSTQRHFTTLTPQEPEAPQKQKGTPITPSCLWILDTNGEPSAIQEGDITHPLHTVKSPDGYTCLGIGNYIIMESINVKGGIIDKIAFGGTLTAEEVLHTAKQHTERLLTQQHSRNTAPHGTFYITDVHRRITTIQDERGKNYPITYIKNSQTLYVGTLKVTDAQFISQFQKGTISPEELLSKAQETLIEWIEDENGNPIGVQRSNEYYPFKLLASLCTQGDLLT